MGDMPAEAKGFDAVSAKTKWWVENHEVHSSKADGTVCRAGHFCRAFRYRCDDKNSGQRFQGSEVGIYKVKDGKVVREEFLP